jgi:eukaryotic-like serine/threonine-protein kinase
MESAPPPRLPPAAIAERLQLVSAASDTLCGAVERAAPDQRNSAVMQAMKPYAAALPVEERALRALVDRALDATAELARALNLDLRASVLGRRLADPTGRVAVTAMSVSAPTDAPMVVAESGTPEAVSDDARAVLAAGIQDVTQGLLEDLPQADLLRIVVETTYRAFGFRRVLLCLREERDRSLVGRHAYGEEGTRPWDRFRVAIGGNDLFALTVARNADLLIHDATQPKVRERLPAWYLEGFSARSFLLMPMRRGDSAVGLLYADQDGAQGVRIGEAEFALLKTLRNQAVLVLKSTR